MTAADQVSPCTGEPTIPNALLRQHAPETHRLLGLFGSKPLVALYTVAALTGLLEVTPGLEHYRLLHPVEARSEKPAVTAPTAPIVVGEAALAEETENHDPVGRNSTKAVEAKGPIATLGVKSEPVVDFATKPPPVPIEDPSGRALDAFFKHLLETKQGKTNAITRIVHFGDSVVASDYVSGTLRRHFQEQFGDGGHGFTLIANAWPAYFHEGISRYATSGWLISRVVGPLASDGWHGLGGVSFRAPPHLLARIGTAKKGDVGRKVSRFELAYVEAPDGGTADIRVDGKFTSVLDTRGPVKRFRSAVFDVPDGEHDFELQTTKGTSRFFGLVLERNTSGVVLDAIGIQGARIRFLDKQDDAHFAEQLSWRNPALVIYQFGANESADGYAYSMVDYYTTMRAVIEQQKKALPQTSCLILAAMDRASQTGSELKSLSIIPLIVEQQRKVAVDLGCAFFDTFKAMGGNGSMPQWVRRGLGQSDLTHPSAVGADILGTWIYRALMQAARDNATYASPKAP
jgi:lysophospholipase L1-like esterase